MTKRAQDHAPTSRTTQLAAWGSFGLFLLVAGGGMGLFLGGSHPSEGWLLLLPTGYAIVGTLVATREPRNAVGWLMLAIAIFFALTGFVEGYVSAHDRPAEALVAWTSNWLWSVWLTLAALILPLVFPSGRLLSPSWRPALWLAIASMLASVISSSFARGPVNVAAAPSPIDNPFGVAGAVANFLDVLGVVGNSLAAMGLGLAGICLAIRLRRSRGREHQQVQWFVYVGALGLFSFAFAMIGVFTEQFNDGDPPAWIRTVEDIGWFLALALIVVGLPLATGMAILRHRLYDIDLVIKRTLVYGALSLLLALTYLGLVLGLRSLLNPLTGESDLAVAASTLAVAALFRPLRTRIQSLVDRRFYRARYDASQAIVAFTAQLRQEVDLDTVTTDLLDVVQETLQPTHATLWLRNTP